MNEHRSLYPSYSLAIYSLGAMFPVKTSFPCWHRRVALDDEVRVLGTDTISCSARILT